MSKISRSITNYFCPQALFLYGNYKDDGTPNFGLFCWLSYCWIDGENGGGLGVMACIGEEKLTKDLIRQKGVFSANLVSQPMLPLADYYGNTSGRTEKNKMRILPTVEKGKVLDVPTIAESPVTFELKVKQEIQTSEHSHVYLCEICNVLAEERLLDKNVPFINRYLDASPVLVSGEERYASVDGKDLGHWGEPMKRLAEKP